MRSTWVVLGLCALASSAHAEDKQTVKAGPYQLSADGYAIDIAKGKRRATMSIGYSENLRVEKLDVKAGTFTLHRDTGCGEVSDELTFDKLEARLVNTEALALHKKKQWDKAAVGFAQAVKLDPTWNLPAYNLASAYAQLGKVTEAAAAMKPWLDKLPITTYRQIAQDPELQPLLASPELRAFKGTAAPGTATVAADGRIATTAKDAQYSSFAGGMAYSASRGWLAISFDVATLGPCAAPRVVTIFDAKREAEIGRITLASGLNSGCRGAQAQARAPIAFLNQLFADFGFVPVEFEIGAMSGRYDMGGKQMARFPRAKLGAVTAQNGSVNVLAGDTQVGQGFFSQTVWDEARYVPAAHVMLLVSNGDRDLCTGTSVDAVAVQDPAVKP